MTALHINQNFRQVLMLKVSQAFLNQAHTWFLKIVSVEMSVCVFLCLCVCLPPRLLTTGGMMWCYIGPHTIA